MAGEVRTFMGLEDQHLSSIRFSSDLSQRQRKASADTFVRELSSFLPLSSEEIGLESIVSLVDPNVATEGDVKAVNKQVKDSFAQECQTVNVTDYAVQKGEYIVQRFKELREERGITGGYEIAFQLIGDIGSGVIDDIFIDRNQRVNNVRCVMTEFRRTSRLIEGLGKEIYGWGHSHTDMNVFFSPTDDDTMVNYFNSRGYKVDLFDLDDNNDNEIVMGKVFYGMVFNEAKDRRALRLLAKVPQFSLIEGDEKEWKVDFLELDFESSPTRTRRTEIVEYVFEDRNIVDESYVEGGSGGTDFDGSQGVRSYEVEYTPEGNVNNWLYEEVVEVDRFLSDVEKRQIDDILLNGIYLEIEGENLTLNEYSARNLRNSSSSVEVEPSIGERVVSAVKKGIGMKDEGSQEGQRDRGRGISDDLGLRGDVYRLNESLGELERRFPLLVRSVNRRFNMYSEVFTGNFQQLEERCGRLEEEVLNLRRENEDYKNRIDVLEQNYAVLMERLS